MRTGFEHTTALGAFNLGGSALLVLRSQTKLEVARLSVANGAWTVQGETARPGRRADERAQSLGFFFSAHSRNDALPLREQVLIPDSRESTLVTLANASLLEQLGKAELFRQFPRGISYQNGAGVRFENEFATAQVPAGSRISLFFDPRGRLFRIAAIRPGLQKYASSELQHASFTPRPFGDRGGMPSID